MVGNLRNVSEELAKRVANGLAIPLPKKTAAASEPYDLKPSSALSIQKNMKPTLDGRCVGILIADGSDIAVLTKLKKSIEKEGATVKIVALRIGSITLSDGQAIKADGQLAGTPSQLFDAVAVVLSAAGTKLLLKEAAAVQWVMDAFGHLKAIAHTPDAKALLDKAGVVPDAGITGTDGAFLKAAATRQWVREPSLRNLA